jgi:DNA-binding SARP family transcriptional activator
MEFRLLGPLDVSDEGRRVVLRGARQRALLAMLLLHANEVVPEERLLEEVWGGARPASGGAALRVRISQLRKALGGTVVATRSPGYLLEVEPAQVDALRFEELLARGRRELATGDAPAAADTLGEALALWRGAPLADLAYEEFAQAEIARLEDLRLSAFEERLEADLALGRHGEVVGELEALVAEHPFRERLRGQLMLALYRSGRQVEALAAYRDARRDLVAELGIEPTRSLQELERAILRQDAALDLPAVSRPSAPAVATGPERKLATVLVAALAGSPGEGDPERAAAVLERVYRALADEIEALGGKVETFVGERLTAVFGAPVAQEDHVERALRSALSMRRRVEQLFGDGMPVRIGVDTGHVLAGRGSPLVGATVATATRLEQAARAGDILVGERAAATVRSAFEFGEPIEDGGVRYRPLLRALSVTREAAPKPFVGRTDELAGLRAAYRRAVDGRRPQLVTVAGEAGVGKTRLVREFWDLLLAESPQPLRRTGRCLAYGRGTTYRPLADVLREELSLLATDTPETVLRRLGQREILGLTLGLDVAPELHPLLARERLHEAWVDFLSELAMQQPVVVLVEDLHWAQDPLLDLLERLLAEVRGPLLLVGTARPELTGERPSWGRRSGAETIWLEPLPPGDAEALLEGLSERELPDGLRRRVLARAEGNPFFLEELLARVVEEESLAADVPDSVQAVLAARIDQLPPVEKEALQAAAVIGRVFWRSPVRALLDGIGPDFAVLEARDFVRRRAGSSLTAEPEFVFKHALTRDVAYAGLPVARRARLHAIFAGWLEESGGGRDEHAAFLAHHYAEAVRPEDADLAWPGGGAELRRLQGVAVSWLRRAAELATGRYELEDAVAMLHRALELDPGEATQLQLWRAIGRANALRHDGDAFLTAMMKAIELSPDDETTGELFADLSFETALRAGMWRRRPGRELVDGWIDRALELAGPDSAARARGLIARSVWGPMGAAPAAREAAEIAERLGDPDLRSYAWDARGITMWTEGHPDLGRAWEERRFELIDRIHDPDHVADIYYAPVTGCIWLGYLAEARRLAARHDEITSTLTPHHRIHGLAVLVEVEELIGDWQRIRDLEARLDSVVLANRDTPCVRSPRSLLVCATAEERLGNAERARALEQHAEAFGAEGYGHVIETPQLRLALLRGRLDLVEELVARPLPDRGWYRGWLLLSTHATRLDALAALGDRDEIEAFPAPRRGTFLEPFHARALGLVREDADLLAQAAACFESLRLAGHAGDTEMLLRR